MSRDSLERSSDIEQAELGGFARSIAEVEWLLLILVMLDLFIGEPGLAREPAVIGVLGGFAAFIVGFRYARFGTRARAKIALEVLAMIGFLTLVLLLAGFATNQLANLYLLPIITAGLALGRRAIVIVLLTVCACYIGLAVLAGDAGDPLVISGQAIGALAPFVLVAFLTTLLAGDIEVAKQRIRSLSDHDELTKLYNMRAFTDLAGREHDLASRNETTYVVLMVDVDALKSINDTYGHEAGNKALKLVADALTRLTRSSDIVARYGGDEFIICLRHADLAVAQEVAQRVRNVVFATTLEIAASIVRLKVSVGVAAYPENGESLQAVITQADRAMYKDKEYREPPKGRLIIHKR